MGVRRIACQQSSMPASVISSQSMHLGVLATASHAVSTQTMFVVYYKPRYTKWTFLSCCYVSISRLKHAEFSFGEILGQVSSS